jgi:diguanylate cyclase (GGDEF)-like protein/PAS domain S-box-containing protein
MQRRSGFRSAILGFILALGLVFAPALAQVSAPLPQAITVVLDDNYPPFVFRNAEGEQQGILVDMWALWSIKTGVKVTLLATDWGNAQRTMEAGKVDVIDTLFRTPAREILYDFSQPYVSIEVPIFFHKSISGIVNAASLRGFNVGVKEGDACIDQLQQNGVFNLTRFSSYESLVHAASTREVRIFCIDAPPATYFLYKFNIESEFRHSPPLYTGAFHRAVKKGDVAVLKLVEDGFSRISDSERIEIEQKWFGKSVQGREISANMRSVGYAALLLLVAALALALWNRMLRRQVIAQTAELTATVAALDSAKQASERVRDHLAATLEAIPDLLFELDSEGRYQDYRAARADLLMVPPDQFLGRTVREVMPAEAADTVMNALQLARENGSAQGAQLRLDLPEGEFWFELSVAPKHSPDSQSQRFIVLSRDITQRKRAEAEVEQLAYFDPLTQLPNRRLLLERVRQAIAASARRGHHGALLFLDLDNFKTLNDTRGHRTGDMLLKEVGARIHACIRVEDTVARIGGDEFVVMLEDLSHDVTEAAAQAESIAEKVLVALQQPYLIEDFDHHSSASIGATLFSGNDVSVDDLLKRADAAMYRAKAAGRNALRFYDPALQANLEARSKLETDLRRAISEQQLILYYQAQVDRSGRIIGAEALLRWRHPELGLIAPALFIPLAEDTGLILPIGRWVTQTACAQLKCWAAQESTMDLRLAVNVSARQFRQTGFISEIQQALQQHDANPARLKLELTESMVLEDVTDAIETINALKALGVGISMDDFGTGYSSLSYLKQLPLDQLKIDQSFIRDIATDASDAVIVRTIIGMAQNFKLQTVAEGVETEEQRQFLLGHHCDVFQGYLFSRPVPLAEFEKLLSV